MPFCKYPDKRQILAVATTRNDEDTPASVTIWDCGYREKCSESGCQNLSRLVLRYADGAGRPIRQFELCFAHGRARVEPGRSDGLKVFDDRESS
jgi:hypothetical protein